MPDEQALKDAILRHVGLYRLTLEAVVRHLFFNDSPKLKGGDPVRNMLDSLVKDKLLRLQQFPNKVEFWTPTIQGAKQAGVRRGRGTPRDAQSLSTHLAVLWFCCMASKRRYRLEPEDLRELFGPEKPHDNIPHCIAPDGDGPRIYRIIFPEQADAATAIQQVASILDEIFMRNRPIHDWIKARDYGMAILGQTEEKCADLNRRIHAQIEGRDPIIARGHCVVELGPSPKTLRMALNRWFNDNR
ncbi:MAG TPA: hypothetical protein VFE46_02015 [Pirellulales bacterium]|jgi:hypothetical protein|nr:hypothetical protein [Pirellulales bacterium]